MSSKVRLSLATSQLRELAHLLLITNGMSYGPNSTTPNQPLTQHTAFIIEPSLIHSGSSR